MLARRLNLAAFAYFAVGVWQDFRGSIGAAAPAATPGRGALRAWIDGLCLDPRARYLSASIDHADCERRARVWDAREQDRIRRPWTW